MSPAQALSSFKAELATARFTPHFALTVGNVVPGEPVKVRWRFDHGVIVRGPGRISVNFFIDGQLVLQRTGIPAPDSLGGGGTGDQTDRITITDPNVARTIYRFGLKELKLQVLAEDTEPQTYDITRSFFVVPEPLDASWWEWRVNPYEEIPWKTGYALVADFVNKCRFATLTQVVADISELRSDDNPDINPCAYYGVQNKTLANMPPGQSQRVQFDFLQAWRWFVDGVYVVTGPTIKTWSYAVSFRCTDEFGNVYDDQCSARLMRTVRVSAAKGAACGAALAAATTAAGLFAAALATLAGFFTAFGAPALFAAAATAYGLARAAGSTANDPPAPDPNYREPVALPAPVYHAAEEPGGSPQLQALRGLIGTAARILALEEARTTTRARLLTARFFGDEHSTNLHRRGYLVIDQQMQQTADTLRQMAAALPGDSAWKSLLPPEQTARWMESIAREGLPPNAVAASGLDAGTAGDLLICVRHRPYTELIRNFGLPVGAVAANLIRFVDEVSRERDGVLAGEVYVPVQPLPAEDQTLANGDNARRRCRNS